MKYNIKQIDVYRDDKRIYGEFYIPEKESFPVTIFCHGLGGVYEGSIDLAQYFASNGIGAFIFDFCGGSNNSKSDGKTTEMSVLTEAADLNAVIDKLKTFAGVEKLFLVGKSQGVFVSTIVASKRKDEIAGIVGLYSGFVLDEKVKEEAKKYDVLPETIEILWLTVGRNYLEDIINNDIYETMKEYSGPVLLIHGTKDEIAPLSYTEKALDYFPNAKLVVLDGADHGFHGPERNDVIKMTYDFINEIVNKK